MNFNDFNLFNAEEVLIHHRGFSQFQVKSMLLFSLIQTTCKQLYVKLFFEEYFLACGRKANPAKGQGITL